MPGFSVLITLDVPFTLRKTDAFETAIFPASPVSVPSMGLAYEVLNKVVEVLKEYSEKYGTLTDEQAEDLMERNFENQEELIDLRKEYFRKMSRAIGAKDAGRFFQLDGVITKMLDLKVSAELPLMK